ncbi:MAG: sce7726 family protein [Bacteroidota bacterium]
MDKKVRKYQKLLGKNFENRRDVLESMYSYMLKNYRCEYVYKNFIANKILLGIHSLNTSTLLDEFKIGSSFADLVFVNGSSTVYEIKTELDSPDRLSDQLSDYKKAFGKVYVVTHINEVDKYREIVSGSSIGLIALSRRNHLSRVKEASNDFTDLDIETMFKCLRKNEYSNILNKYFGYTPDVGNMSYFRESLKMAQKIDTIDFHKLMNVELKKRKPREVSVYDNTELPNSLVKICLSIDPSQEQYNKLFQYLGRGIQ